MNWFCKYCNNFENDDINLSQFGLVPNYMEMMPNGQRYWQVSLNKAFSRAQEQFGNLLEGPEFETGEDESLPSEQNAVKRMIFYQWFEKVPPKLSHTDYFKKSVAEHVIATQHFNPFPEFFQEREPGVEVPSSDELSAWWTQS